MNSSSKDENVLVLSSSKMKMSLLLYQVCRNVSLYQCLINGCSAVNGCHQNESLIQTSQQSSASVNIRSCNKSSIKMFLTQIRVHNYFSSSEKVSELWIMTSYFIRMQQFEVKNTAGWSEM